jgi:hypothetical protein
MKRFTALAQKLARLTEQIDGTFFHDLEPYERAEVERRHRQMRKDMQDAQQAAQQLVGKA